MTGLMDPRRWEEIQVTFDTLVELDGVERGDRLTALSSTDPELRAAVESLLAADSEVDARLAPLESAFLPQSAPATDPLGLSGCTISHFEVREPLGAGGMGVVYRAEDTRLGRIVALKFLLPPYNLDAAARARFLREAHLAAALDHRNLCTVHEVGASDDGRLFLAMALYPGETLKARLARDGAMSVCEILEIAREVAEGLEAAHAAGVVHRDLKPGNVMLLPDGTVKILDFGLAKARDQSLSETGARFGTVSYMAPEQIRGGAVDGRADLWALGVVLYEMLTRRKPFSGEAEVAIAHAILHDEPVLPSTNRGDLSAALEDLVLRLLQKDPAKRYPTAVELLGDLARVGTVAAGTRDSLRRHLRRVSRILASNSGRMLAAGAAIVLIGAGGYAAIARKSVAPAAAAARTAIAVMPFRNLSAEGPNAYFAGGLHDEVLTQLYKVPGLKVIGRTSVMTYAGPNAPPLREIASELGVGSVIEGSVQVVGDRLRVTLQLIDAATGRSLWAERYERTLDDAFAIQSDIAQQIVMAVGAVLSSTEQQRLAEAPTVDAEAYRLYLQGRDYWNRPGYLRQNLESAQQLFEGALALDWGFALAHAALSEVHGRMYWFSDDHSPALAARQREEAEAALRLAPDLPQAHIAMGMAHHYGRVDRLRALEEFTIALKRVPNDADVWERLGYAHRRLGNWNEVDVAFENATDLDPRDADLFYDLGGLTFIATHRYPEAILAFDRALILAPDLHESAFEKAHTYVLWRGQFDTLRAVLDRTPRDAESMHYGTKAAQYAQILYWERRADSLLNMLTTAPAAAFRGGDWYPRSLFGAWAHQLRGDESAARAAFDSARLTLDSVLREFPDGWSAHAARGLALAGLGRDQGALREARWLQESVTYQKDAFMGPAFGLARARILAQVGQADAALDEIERRLAGPALLSVQTLRLDPLWDPIREHPRFHALLAKYGT